MNRLTIVFVMLAAAFYGSGLLLIRIPLVDWYDEGVYQASAIRVAEGDEPYRDFFFAHPPGVVWLGAACVGLGLNIYDIRLVYWSLGILFLALLARFVVAVQRSAEASTTLSVPVACLSVLFCTASPLLQSETTQILTHLPVLILTLLGFSDLVRPHGPRPLRAGLWLAAASVFRVQAAYTAPAWAVFLLLSLGWKSGLRASVWLAIGAGVGALLFHGAMVLTHENYWDCIINFHIKRPVSGFSLRAATLLHVLQEPQGALGLIGASCLVLSGQPAVRGLAGFCLVSFALTLFGSRFVQESYFVQVWPYLLMCGPLLLAQIPLRGTVVRNLLAGALCVVIIQLTVLVPTFAYRLFRLGPLEADFIARLQATEGNIVLTTHVKVAHYTNKKPVSDYNNPDCCEQDMTTRCAWFIAMAQRADIIVVNEELLKWSCPELYPQLLAMGKPIVFATETDRVEFQRRAKSKPYQPMGQ